MNKYVIYTAVVGNYDEILQPKVIDDRFDYILFSNDIKESNVGVWQVRPIDYTNEVQTKIARWVKTHPEELLPGYEFSVWMDANIQILTDFVYNKAVKLYEDDFLLSAVKHSVRSCVYEEIAAVIYYYFESYNIAICWGKFLLSESYPQYNGMNETGVLFRKHTNIIKKMDELWWYCIERYSRRDQLSFNYSCWQVGIVCEPFLQQGSVRNSEDFECNVAHKNTAQKSIENKKYIRQIYDSCNDWNAVGNVMYWSLRKRNTMLWLGMVGFFWNFRYSVKKLAKACLGVNDNCKNSSQI
jgi:hypothetical protein